MTDKPLMNIMQIKDFEDAKVFRVACDCTSNDHGLDLWIEAKKDEEFSQVDLSFYVKGTSPFWDKKWNRFKAAWQMIWNGYHEWEHVLILDSESAKNLADVIKTYSEELEQKRLDK